MDFFNQFNCCLNYFQTDKFKCNDLKTSNVMRNIKWKRADKNIKTNYQFIAWL